MVKQKPIVPDQGWSWAVLLAAFLCNVIFDGVIFSFGIFFIEFLDYFGEGRSRTSWVGSIISGVYAIIGPLASVLVNKYGCRRVTVCGAIVAFTGFLLSTFSPGIWMLILTYGIMGGVGFGLMYLSAYVMIGHYFERRRALATGLAACGSGVGTFIFAPLSMFLIDTFGWKGGMWITAGIVLNGVVMGAVFRPLPVERDDQGNKVKPALLDLGLLRMPSFVVFCMSSFLCLIGFFIPIFYLPDLARKQGYSREEGARVLLVFASTNTIGRILCGWVCDKPWADPLKIYNSALIIGGTVTICSSLLTEYWMLCGVAAIFGLCLAAYVSLCAIILVEFLGLERLSNSFGFLNMFRGIATFIGPPLAGVLYDITGDYDLAFYVAGASMAAAGVICLPLRIFKKCDCGMTSLNRQEREFSERLHEDDLANLSRKEWRKGPLGDISIDEWKKLQEFEGEDTFIGDVVQVLSEDDLIIKGRKEGEVDISPSCAEHTCAANNLKNSGENQYNVINYDQRKSRALQQNITDKTKGCSENIQSTLTNDSCV